MVKKENKHFQLNPGIDLFKIETIQKNRRRYLYDRNTAETHQTTN